MQAQSPPQLSLFGPDHQSPLLSRHQTCVHAPYEQSSFREGLGYWTLRFALGYTEYTNTHTLQLTMSLIEEIKRLSHPVLQFVFGIFMFAIGISVALAVFLSTTVVSLIGVTPFLGSASGELYLVSLWFLSIGSVLLGIGYLNYTYKFFTDAEE